MAVLGATAVGMAAWAAGHPDSSAWKPLFAADLSDAEFPAGVWSVKDGEMTATEDQCIWTKASFENFTLDLEFKTGEAANSGVVIYCTDVKNWIPNSVEVQILDDFSPKWKDAAPTWRCGGIFGHLAPSKSAVKKPGEWNRMTITARGPMITTVLNGETVSVMDMRKWTSAKTNPDGSEIPPWLSRPFAELATKGRIGLQGKHGGALITFRNVKIRSEP
ncbi:MAG: DUF1080 domain-containing protein [Lentisphaerae bacterium]|nr:DUF1080 domain-containing protein [Lentisphaerota bacterium]